MYYYVYQIWLFWQTFDFLSVGLWTENQSTKNGVTQQQHFLQLFLMLKATSPVKEHRHKPHLHLKPYVQPKQINKNLPKTSAIKPQKYAQSNLTLSDWLTVIQYYDSDQPISQPQVVKYFANHPEGALLFNQSSLSWHLSKQGCNKIQTRYGYVGESWMALFDALRFQWHCCVGIATTTPKVVQSPEEIGQCILQTNCIGSLLVL